MQVRLEIFRMDARSVLLHPSDHVSSSRPPNEGGSRPVDKNDPRRQHGERVQRQKHQVKRGIESGSREKDSREQD